jgi:hypothetical protein
MPRAATQTAGKQLPGCQGQDVPTLDRCQARRQRRRHRNRRSILRRLDAYPWPGLPSTRCTGCPFRGNNAASRQWLPIISIEKRIVKRFAIIERNDPQNAPFALVRQEDLAPMSDAAILLHGAVQRRGDNRATHRFAQIASLSQNLFNEIACCVHAYPSSPIRSAAMNAS